MIVIEVAWTIIAVALCIFSLHELVEARKDELATIEEPSAGLREQGLATALRRTVTYDSAVLFLWVLAGSFSLVRNHITGFDDFPPMVIPLLLFAAMVLFALRVIERARARRAIRRYRLANSSDTPKSGIKLPS